MNTGIVGIEGNKLTLQVTVDISGSLLEAEERIQNAVNEIGSMATQEAIARFDTDGSPIMTGPIKWTRRCRSNKVYQTPYGDVSLERNVYQTSRGGKSFVPLEAAARIIRCATPRFAKIVSSKYARLNVNDVRCDLLENHARPISKITLQRVAESVGSIAQAKEQSWSYSTPTFDQAIDTVVCSLDGAYLLTCDDGWKESMVGAISLYDCEGERYHTTYFGAAPQYGKADFLERFERELSHIKQHYPNALYIGIADGAKSNWSFLGKHTERQLLDFYHVTEYLGRVSYAAFPQKTGKPERQKWLSERCHQLKHVPGAAQSILKEMRGFKRRRKLSRVTREDLESAISYFENQSNLMDYATHVEQKLPIGSGVTEAACKTLIKQRFCCSGMRWKEAGIKTVLSLRALVQTKGRWNQFWAKIEKYGVSGIA